MPDKPKQHPQLLARCRRRIDLMRHATLRFGHYSMPVVANISTVLMVLTVIASAMCLTILTVHVGFDHSTDEFRRLHNLIRLTQGIFITNVLFNIIFNFKATFRNSRIIKWIVDIAILITILPWIYPHPANPWIPWLEALLYSNKFLYSVLAAYSVVMLSFAIFRLLGRRTNPSLLMSMSFLVFIIIGSFMLMLPKCTYGGITYIDSLFVSTSAISITGLTPVDVPATFTPLGTLILAILIQIGALGVMTFTSFFALFFSGNTSIYSQLMLKDMVYSKNMSSLIPTLLYILGFTIVVEAIGAVMIFFSIHDTLGLSLTDEIFFAAFHSVSAFCNAGFSNYSGGFSNPLLLDHNISIYWIMSLIIVAGAIGFPILVNFRDAIVTKIKNIVRRLRHHSDSFAERQMHLYNMNTKIVLLTFAILFVAGTVLFYLMESDNSLAGMNQWQKITQSVFNSVVPRSAGFASVSPAGFLNVTIVMLLFLMWVGGASQSTAGGVKVNTLAAIGLNIRAIVTGAPHVTAFRRNVSTGSIRRANAVVALSITAYLAFSVAVIWLEPDLPARDLLFESCSALFTVGSSLGVTSSLSDASKAILCVAMFLGRVGIISLLTGLVRHRSVTGVSYPTDNIIIN